MLMSSILKFVAIILNMFLFPHKPKMHVTNPIDIFKIIFLNKAAFVTLNVGYRYQ